MKKQETKLERVVHTRIKRKSFLQVLIYIGYLLNANCVLWGEDEFWILNLCMDL